MAQKNFKTSINKRCFVQVAPSFQALLDDVA